MPSHAEPACNVGRAPSDPPSQRLGIDMVAGTGDALNTQDNVRRDDAEHNDLSHVHNLTQSRTGRLHAQTQVAPRDGVSLAPVLDRQSLRLATPRWHSKVPPSDGAQPCPRHPRQILQSARFMPIRIQRLNLPPRDLGHLTRVWIIDHQQHPGTCRSETKHRGDLSRRMPCHSRLLASRRRAPRARAVVFVISLSGGLLPGRQPHIYLARDARGPRRAHEEPPGGQPWVTTTAYRAPDAGSFIRRSSCPYIVSTSKPMATVQPLASAYSRSPPRLALTSTKSTSVSTVQPSCRSQSAKAATTLSSSPCTVPQ